MTSFAGSHPVSSEYPEVAHHGMSPMKYNAPPPNEQWTQPQASPTGYQSGLEHAKEGQPYAGPHGAGQAATEKRVGGLKASIFWLIIFLVSLVVIGASVGAGIGACQSQKGGGSCGNAAAAAQSSSP